MTADLRRVRCHPVPPTSHVPRPLTSRSAVVLYLKAFESRAVSMKEKSASLFGGRFSQEPEIRIRRAHRHWNSTSYRTAAGYPRTFMELRGVEPLTSAVRLQRSPN